MAIVQGTTGNDIIDSNFVDLDGDSVSGAADTVFADPGDDTVFGLGGNDIILGGDGNDTLVGGAGADQLFGGGLLGGSGIDTASYQVSSARVVVSLSTGQGLNGDAQGDTLSFIDNLRGSAHDDSLEGNALANVIEGLGGDDRMDGGAGADHMIGGLGNDRYDVDDPGDIVDEGGGDGNDVVVSVISFALGEDVERLVLAGDTDLNGTGNALDNVLLGTKGANILDGAAGADTMIGGAGNDTYVVDDTGDVVEEDALVSNGFDTVESEISFSLAQSAQVIGEFENLTLLGTADIDGSGNTLANLLAGNAGANILDGGAGADTMRGLAGNDTYVVDDAGDIVDETAAGSDGVDTVLASVSFVLGDGVENLTLSGGGAINGTGNELANVILGNDGNNVLEGRAGNDAMTGGLGTDRFVFNSALDKTSNLDTIADFFAPDDTILLDNAIFKKLKTDGALKKKYFEVGKKADDKDDFIVHNKKTGDLFYDKNGDKKGGAILFAHLDGGPDDLSKADFLVI